MTTIAADPKHLGARIGLTAVLHTWGSAMTHHPHIHMIVPGGGLSPDGTGWIASRPAFLLPVRVLGALFRRLFLEGLAALHKTAKLAFHGALAHLTDPRAFARHLAPVRRKRWSSTPSRPSRGQRPSWPTCRATLNASPSRPGASPRSTAAPSPSASRTTARTAPPATAP